MTWNAHARTDVGRVRTQNEDAYLVDDGLGLAVVADGMGGHACGEVASHMTVTLFREALAEQRALFDAYRCGADRDTTRIRAALRDAMRRCSKAVYEEARRDPGKDGMGTTCSALVVAGHTAFVAHVGDSRIYRVRDQRVVQVTRDHSLLEQLVREGQLTATEAKSQAYACYRSALARAVGIEPDVDVDVIAVEALPGDTFVLASDGLTRYIHEEELVVEVADAEADDDVECRLVDIANNRGGADNVTVIVVRLGESESDVSGPIRLDDKIRALRRGAVFRAMSYADILHVLSHARTCLFPRGATVMDARHGGDAVNAVLSGSVRLEGPGGSGTGFGPGEAFGASTLAEAGAERVVAAEDTRLLVLLRDDLMEISRASPEAGDRLLETLARAG